MPRVYSIDGITPVVDPSAYVHPSAVLIGQEVTVGHGAVPDRRRIDIPGAVPLSELKAANR